METTEQKFGFIFISLIINTLALTMAYFIIKYPLNSPNRIIFIVLVLSVNTAHLLLKLIRFDGNGKSEEQEIVE